MIGKEQNRKEEKKAFVSVSKQKNKTLSWLNNKAVR
jgi:hypothetical protein